MRSVVPYVCGIWLGMLVSLAEGAETIAPRVDFQRDIRPILSDKCLFCHGPDEKHRQADLRLDSRLDVLERKPASVVIPGKPADSELWRRISSNDPQEVMPPPESQKSLNQRERDLIKLWIEQGAEWKEHWAWTPPLKPQVPSRSADSEALNAIDLFIEGRLKPSKLKLSPRADPRTLIRRYSFDLIGLPPTLSDVEAFVSVFDIQPEVACERLVDRLLASPHYGERMATWWFDLVRFADTVGYHGDQEHAISPYRDYVIEAFNDNLPFDRFTREQLAGDLIPDATVEQKIASGYNRLLQTSHEGGVQQKEYLAKYASDRVRNFGSVWVGVTLQCAECHDHKFDPLPQRDFYRLAAFFADIEDIRSFKGGDTNPTKREPELEVTTRLVPDVGRRTMVTVAVEPRTIRVLGRGDWMDETGEIVQPGVPTVFKQLTLTQRSTRLDLANWVTSRDNPLTARVFVNRLWKLYFGKGLSGRLDDFGSQGEAPVNPELLDWLAVEFMESGWNIKHIIRLMVLSATYQQTSVGQAFQPDNQHANSENTSLDKSGSRKVRLESLTHMDADNRLLSHQSRWRLDAEMIRDNALAVSGLLNHRMGGRSVRPYQPDGYYQFLNFPKRIYVADNTDDRYRRGVYVHWQRAYLLPMLKAFDAPSREECTCERPRSVTPQAALVLLNDPTIIEAAEAFARRIVREGGNGIENKLHWAWRTALSRELTDREYGVISELLTQELADETGRSRPGRSPAQDDLPAWTVVARAILNLNEFVTRN